MIFVTPYWVSATKGYIAKRLYEATNPVGLFYCEYIFFGYALFMMLFLQIRDWKSLKHLLPRLNIAARFKREPLPRCYGKPCSSYSKDCCTESCEVELACSLG